MLRKFVLFFLAFFIMAFVIQMFIMKSDQEIVAILVKTFISGLVAAGVFLFITRNK